VSATFGPPGARSDRVRRGGGARALRARLFHSSAAGAQLLRFGSVGTVGFVVDSLALLLAIHGLGLDPYRGRLVSFLVAASTTWALNRRFTFHDRRRARLTRQWASFLAVNGLGGLVNYATYALLVARLDPVTAWPVLGVAAGSLAGLAFNFTLSRRLVFRIDGAPARSGA
jgi:putative flippase GtrA